MASTSTTESTPLLSSAPSSPADAQRKGRNVTFNPNPSVISIDNNTSSVTRPISATTSSNFSGNVSGSSSQQPMLSALNSRLRRRNSSGSPLMPMSTAPASKIGPQRTTKNTQKLKLLPNPEPGEDGDEESGRDVYSQYTRIKDPTARRDAARLGKADRDRLPRVTAYCTANKYQLDNLMRFLKGRGKAKGANPKQFDECVYTPYNYGRLSERATSRMTEVQSMPVHMRERRHSDSAIEVEDNNKQRREDLIDLHTEAGDTTLSNGEIDIHNLHSPSVERQMRDGNIATESNLDFDTQVHTPEVFLFDYGVVVIWGMSLQHEQRFLKEIAKFESEKLAADDVETECFNFYYTREYQARIYNDFITLREKGNYMTKLAISHALAQSVKTSLFEELVDNTIETCKDIPTQIATTGKIALNRKQINMQIGELFILRINIHLNGSVLDTPELFWVEPQLEPVYQAVRSYLEMDQRVSLLTERLDVIADLLAVLKDQLSHGHGEMLEWIVIVLIAAEIVVAGVNILVDVYAGVD
ncbi:probable RMD1-protein required for Meiotic Division [Rhynchosporium agropyri]|uniref:Probable RMD1-protein required for Meiotic Division n=2 Tax=Rhynchosporium TaxID=38037 RepID=A0A1E1K5H2_9HELO|nr:probable RMD1-protein required for Meiotic Division [Rhynchosporium agropyri]CZT06751.1 probable RMD1-protein required for Meiotic Division [Rhynchosporium commune]